ncbi:MAG: hypothetical protein ACODAD_01985 [Planctomycetota bacterium]
MKSLGRVPFRMRMAVFCSLLALGVLALYWKYNRPKEAPRLVDNNLAPRAAAVPKQKAVESSVQRSDPSQDATPPNVNLLKEYDLGKSVIQGAVFVRNYSIVSGSKPCWIQVPMELAPHSQYELEVCVTRTEDDGHFFLALPIEDHAGVIAIDKNSDQLNVPLSGLEYLDKKEMSDPGFYPLPHRGRILPEGKPVHIVVRVEANQVSVAVNNQTIYRYRGDLSAVSLPLPYRSKLTYKTAYICLGGNRIGYRLDRLEYRPLERAEPPRVAAAEPSIPKPAQTVSAKSRSVDAGNVSPPSASSGDKTSGSSQKTVPSKPPAPPAPVTDPPDVIVTLGGKVEEALVAGQRLVARVTDASDNANDHGGGRLAVIDLAGGRISREIELLPEESHFAAGLDTLITLNPANGDARRFNLSTGEVQWKGQLENHDVRVVDIFLGTHATGPLWMVREGQDLQQFDPRTFWPINLSRTDTTTTTILRGSEFTRGHLSGDGQTLALWQPQFSRRGYHLLRNSAGEIDVFHQRSEHGAVLPNFDGDVVATQKQVFDRVHESLESAPFETIEDFAFIPAVTGPFYLRVPRTCPLSTRRFEDKQDRNKTPATNVGVFLRGCVEPVHEIQGAPVFPVAHGTEVSEHEQIEPMPHNRLFLLPEIETVAAIPVVAQEDETTESSAAGEIWLYRFDIDAGLRAAGVERPLVYSQPNQLQVSPGETFTYQPSVFNPADDPLRYVISSAPAGATIDVSGRISWRVAEDTEPGEFPVRINMSSKAGAAPHEFVLEVPPSTHDIPTNRVMAQVANPSTHDSVLPEPLVEPLTLDLPFSVSEVHNAGEYLVMRVTNGNRLALFDLRRRVLTRLWDLGQQDVVCAAGADKLVKVDADTLQIERWGLESGQLELSRQLPGTTAPDRLRIGACGNGPIWAATEHRLYAIDLDTLEMIGGSDVSGFNYCVSGDGQTAGSWATSGSPSGFATRRIVGGEIEELYEHVDADQIFPNYGASVCFVTGRRGVYNGQFKQLDRPPYEQINDFLLLPSTVGPYCFGIPRHLLERIGAPISRHYEVPIFIEGLREPLATFKDTNVQPIVRGLRNSPYDEDILLNHRIIYRPGDDLVTFLAASNDQLRIFPFDAGTALKRAKADTLVVYSFPPSLRFKPGGSFRYQIRAYDPEGAAAYFLADAPKAMSVSKSGLVEWDVPADEERRDVPLTIMVRSKEGKVAYQNLTLFIRKPAKSRATGDAKPESEGPGTAETHAGLAQTDDQTVDVLPGEPPLADVSTGEWQVGPVSSDPWPPTWTCNPELNIELQRYTSESCLFPRPTSPFVAIRQPHREPTAEGRVPAVPASSFTMYQVFDVRSGLPTGTRFVEQGMYGKMSIHDLSADAKWYLALEYKSDKNGMGRPPLSQDPGAIGVLEVHLLPTDVPMPDRPMLTPEEEDRQPKTDKRPDWVPEDKDTLLDRIDVFEHGELEHVRCVLAGGRRVMVFSEGVYRLYDVDSREKVFEKKTGLTATTLSPCGTYVASTSGSAGEIGTVEIHDIRNLVRAGMIRVKLEERENLVDTVFSPDGTQLCCTVRDANGNQTFNVYELDTQSLVAEHELAQRDLTKISNMLDWHQSPSYLNKPNPCQFTIDNQQLVIADQVIMNLQDGTLSTPLVQGQGLPSGTRAVYTGPLQPMPGGGFLGLVHDGERVSLRFIEGPEDSPQDDKVPKKSSSITTNQTGYAVDVTLPLIETFSRDAAEHEEVSDTRAVTWRMKPPTVDASQPETGPPLHGTTRLFDPDRRQIRTALFPTPSLDGMAKPIMALSMTSNSPGRLRADTSFRVTRFDYGPASYKGAANLPQDPAKSLGLSDDDSNSPQTEQWPVPLHQLDIPFGTEPVSLSQTGRFLLCRLLLDVNRLDVFDLDSEKHHLGFRPYAFLERDHDRLEGSSKTAIVQTNWIDDRHVLTMNRTGLLILWDLEAKKALYETQVERVRAIDGTSLDRYFPIGEAANAGLPNKAVAVLPPQTAGAAFQVGPRGDVVLVRSEDALIALNSRTGKPLGVLNAAISPGDLGDPTAGVEAAPVQPLRVREIAFSPDGHRLAALVSDGAGERDRSKNCTRQAIVTWLLETGTLSGCWTALPADPEAKLLGWTDPTHCLVLERLERYGHQAFGRGNIKKYQLLDMDQVRPVWRYEAEPGHEHDPTAVVTIVPDGRVWTATLHVGDRLRPEFSVQRLPDPEAVRFLASHPNATDGARDDLHLNAGDTVALDFSFTELPDFIDTQRCRNELQATFLSVFSDAGIVVSRDSENRLTCRFENHVVDNDTLVKLAHHLPQFSQNNERLSQLRSVLKNPATPYSTMECTVTLSKKKGEPRTLEVLTAATLNEVLRGLTRRIEPPDKQTMRKLQEQQFQAIVNELKSASIRVLSGERPFHDGLGTSVFDNDSCHLVERGRRSVNGLAAAAAEAALNEGGE